MLPASTRMPLEPNRRIGAYEVLDQLGSGGMGEVYRARDTRLGRIVAIKLISSDLHTDADARERLSREAQLASSLNHPNIVTVYDVGETEGRPFIVMELVAGESLHQRLFAGPLRPREALTIAAQVADGLAAAHAAGVVHRDLKPQNIMLTSDGRAKIVDFGLSKLTPAAAGPEEGTSHGSVLTAAHAILGSAGYMAPEQVTGQPVDGRADQFALGAVLYELLTGKRAFKKDTSVQTMAAILEDEPPSLATIVPSLPPQAALIVERCLSKRSDGRYASTQDLARDLHDARDAVGHSTRSQTWTPPPRSLSVPWWGIAAGVLLLVIALVVSMRERTPAPADSGPVTAGTLRQLAILPFVNITKDPLDQILCDGIVETLTSSLTQLERFERALRVVPASEIRRDNIASAREAYSAFGATTVITGAVQRSGASLRLTLNLVDAVELRQLGSRTIDVAPGRDASTQDTVVNAAAALLDLELDPESRQALAAGGTAVPDAYENYVRARGYLQRLDRAENVDHAIEFFSKAVAADSQYALAHAGLGEASWRKYELTREPHWIDRAVASCGQALEIDERLAPVHVTLALIARGRGRYEEAVALAGRASELDPVSSDAFRELGRAYEALGRYDAAETTYQKAITARPDDWLAYNTLGAFYFGRGRPQEAETQFRHVLTLTPDNTRAFNNLGSTLFALGRPEDAAAMWEKSASIRPTAIAVSNLGTYYFDRGRYTDSARAFERAVTLTANDYRLWRNLGAARYWAPGQRAAARPAFEEAVKLAERARDVNPREPNLLAALADSFAMIGLADAARQTAAALAALDPTEASVLFTMAGMYEHLGERDLALAWLEKAVANGYSRERIARSPTLAELRKDARYKTVIK